jgi:hypothetical protein
MPPAFSIVVSRRIVRTKLLKIEGFDRGELPAALRIKSLLIR